MRKALCFGAGNIGRGFIAQVCQESDVHLTFVDVNEVVLNQLNQDHQYTIHLLDEVQTCIVIKNVDGVNSNDIATLSSLITEVDFVFTAVGPNVLKHVGATLAQLYKQHPNLQHHVIACENMVGGSTALKNHVLASLDSCLAGVKFLDAAVDRIVPLSQKAGTLDVKVEPSFEWIVQTTTPLHLNGVEEVTYLEPYIKRKLLMVNGAHAFTAYLGLLQEHQLFLNHTFQLEINNLSKMQDKVIQCFKNALLQDDCIRVGRTPLRKIGLQERLSMGIKTLISLGYTPTFAYQAIAAATLYHYDEEGEALSKMNEDELKEKLLSVGLHESSIKHIFQLRIQLLKGR